MKPRVLITKHICPDILELVSRQAELDYRDEQEGIPREELRRRLVGKRGVLSQVTDRLDASVLETADELKIIANVATGTDNVDLAYASARRILVSNTPDVLTETTADLAFALMLSTARRVVEADRYLRAGRWSQWSIDLFCGLDVYQRTLGIIGLGRIGQAVARRARGFGMTVLYHNQHRLAADLEQALAATHVPLERLLRESDFITLHAPLSGETHHLIGPKELSWMKPTAILINTARGPLVDEAALAEALARGQIAGAGLDVFEQEPRVDPRLLSLANVALTPHIGSASIETRNSMCQVAAINLIAALRGERPPQLVNPEALA